MPIKLGDKNYILRRLDRPESYMNYSQYSIHALSRKHYVPTGAQISQPQRDRFTASSIKLANVRGNRLFCRDFTNLLRIFDHMCAVTHQKLKGGWPCVNFSNVLNICEIKIVSRGLHTYQTTTNF